MVGRKKMRMKTAYKSSKFHIKCPTLCQSKAVCTDCEGVGGVHLSSMRGRNRGHISKRERGGGGAGGGRPGRGRDRRRPWRTGLAVDQPGRGHDRGHGESCPRPSDLVGLGRLADVHRGRSDRGVCRGCRLVPARRAAVGVATRIVGAGSVRV